MEFSLDRSVATLVFTRNEIQPVTEIRTDIISLQSIQSDKRIDFVQVWTSAYVAMQPIFYWWK